MVKNLIKILAKQFFKRILKLFCKHNYIKIFERYKDDIYVPQHNSSLTLIYSLRTIGYKCEKCGDIHVEFFDWDDCYL